LIEDAATSDRAGRLDLAPSDPPPAIIVGLDCITGLQTARLLHARGVPVIGLAADVNHFCARTRVPRATFRTDLRGEALVESLIRLGERLPDVGVLIPCTDSAVLAIAAGADVLVERYRFVLPDHDVVNRLMDKIAFAEHAAAHDLPIPPTAVLRSREDAERAAGMLAYPAVVKPALKTAAWVAATKAKAIRVASGDELIETWQRASAWSDTLIAQSWIPGADGDLYSVNSYHDRSGAPRIGFVARKLRQWPVDTGTSSLGEEVRNDEVREIAMRLFATVPYRGLGYVEVKRNADTGRHEIIEPNIGRPTGRSAIAERGGVELVYTAYRDALGEPLPDASEQTYRGVKWIYWRHDLQSAIVHARRGELGFVGWLRSVRGSKTEAVGSWQDPVPFVADLLHAVGVIGRRIACRTTRGRVGGPVRT
jgi:predicted ATP-grasp superfamily ATP-dependent carboligase